MCRHCGGGAAGRLACEGAKTRSDAFAQAHVLLDQAEERQWFNGEVVSVEVRQADE
jgi:hypothetical protein